VVETADWLCRGVLKNGGILTLFDYNYFRSINPNPVFENNVKV
jgi:hypothetical protein